MIPHRSLRAVVEGIMGQDRGIPATPPKVEHRDIREFGSALVGHRPPLWPTRYSYE
jgi:hypothetical protein